MTKEQIIKTLRIIYDYNLEDRVWWRVTPDDSDIEFFVNTNDFLYWGVADSEPITKETLPVLIQSRSDCLAIDARYTNEHPSIFCLLFSCRLNKMRPQRPAYPKDERFWALLDACGDVRPD